ncbi:MAG: lipid A biosynthesis acyltransferase [Sphingobacteriales bacterium]|nr:MAG: lipid A biosynthesis acyltransferase [Sphingobacteriales bacterium]
MAYIGYLLFRFAVFIISRIPFPLLYGVSDILRFLMFHVFGYRKKIVLANLRRCFPAKTEIEIQNIAWKFYRNFCDITLESIKTFHLSAKEIKKRANFLSTGLANDLYERNQSFIAICAHYANWEWCAAVGLYARQKAITIFRPLANPYINAYGLKSRETFGMKFVPNHQTSLTFEQHRHQTIAVTFLADQNPGSIKKAYWVKYFDQDTACPYGPEKHAHNNNLPVYYVRVERIKRGYYNIELIPLAENPKDYAEGEITQKYMSLLEQIVKNKPEDWLWTHRRWKHKKPEPDGMG